MTLARATHCAQRDSGTAQARIEPGPGDRLLAICLRVRPSARLSRHDCTVDQRHALAGSRPGRTWAAYRPWMLAFIAMAAACVSHLGRSRRILAGRNLVVGHHRPRPAQVCGYLHAAPRQQPLPGIVVDRPGRAPAQELDHLSHPVGRGRHWHRVSNDARRAPGDRPRCWRPLC